MLEPLLSASGARLPINRPVSARIVSPMFSNAVLVMSSIIVMVNKDNNTCCRPSMILINSAFAYLFL